MPLFTAHQRSLAQTISKLVYGNPFQPTRIELEKEALGNDYQQDQQSVWSLIPNATTRRANIDLLVQHAEKLAETIRDKLRNGHSATSAELQLYDDVIMHLLYYRSFDDWYEFMPPEQVKPPCYRSWVL